MKKLSLFIYSMAGGGAERVVSNLLVKLVEKYEVHLILMNDTIAYEIPKNVKIHYIEKSKPFENGILKFLKLPNLALRYRDLCNKLKIDVHFVWMNRPCFIAAIAKFFDLKGKLIFNECSTPSVLYSKRNLKSKIGKFLIRKLYPKADFIMPNSLGNLRDLERNFGISRSKMEVLYNAVDLEKIETLSKESIEFKNPFFLSVGRLDSGKNFELLIRAYSKLKHCDKDLIILGDGVLKEHLKSVIDELRLTNKVHLLGFDKNPYKYMAKCYAFVFVSRFEGFSNVLIEALACNKFVISSDHKSGANELLGENDWGFLIPVDDEKQTMLIMQTALNEPEFVKYYENRAKIRALNFDRDKIAKDLINKIEEICEK